MKIINYVSVFILFSSCDWKMPLSVNELYTFEYSDSCGKMIISGDVFNGVAKLNIYVDNGSYEINPKLLKAIYISPLGQEIISISVQKVTYDNKTVVYGKETVTKGESVIVYFNNNLGRKEMVSERIEWFILPDKFITCEQKSIFSDTLKVSNLLKNNY